MFHESRLMQWTQWLSIDPTDHLLAADGVLPIYVERYLLKRERDTVKAAMECREVKGFLRAQSADGSWNPTKGRLLDHHARLVMSFKNFRRLVHHYELERQVPEVARAAEFLFSTQTEEGDLRGMIGGQYATYYTGEMLSLLIQAGYAEDERVERGMQWLLGMRQYDGGWTIPVLTRGLSRKDISRLTAGDSDPIAPDRGRPFSHNWTDMVLRAFAAHPRYRNDSDALRAAELLKRSFFAPDHYSSHQEPRYWTRFVGWWPNLLTALETLYRMGYDKNDDDVARGIAWFIGNQADDGLWDLEDGRPGKPADREWLTFRVCRMLRSFEIR